jgi:hypothetical protein
VVARKVKSEEVMGDDGEHQPGVEGDDVDVLRRGSLDGSSGQN